jgi:hypothetical protein
MPSLKPRRTDAYPSGQIETNTAATINVILKAGLTISSCSRHAFALGRAATSARLEKYTLVRCATCGENCLSQILGKFQVPFRVSQDALQKSYRGSEVGRITSASIT